ncbi:hypothetical protein [uncultured Jatrophihabitans sp.]|uniref:hypothetical protein n=1 Tax=uncultured Jatrophihabitans sp. TaxID=1610747 RepID=UPI0035CB7012
MTSDDQPRPHRPARYADLTELIDAAGGESIGSRAEMAAATAEVVVRAGRTPGDGARFVGLADRVGLDTLAALWRDADPVSLPGALWALYLLRQWCHTSGDEVARLWRLGEPLAPAEAAVAGVADYADVAAIRDAADAVLAGVYQGDLAVALERAAAFFRVVATGRRALSPAESTTVGDTLTADDSALADEAALAALDASGRADAADALWAERNERVAAALSAAAAKWRQGTLR